MIGDTVRKKLGGTVAGWRLLGGTVYIICFFFQAEDGIRDLTVTGVQTCALPICARRSRDRRGDLRELSGALRVRRVETAPLGAGRLAAPALAAAPRSGRDAPEDEKPDPGHRSVENPRQPEAVALLADGFRNAPRGLDASGGLADRLDRDRARELRSSASFFGSRGTRPGAARHREEELPARGRARPRGRARTGGVFHRDARSSGL